MGNGDGHDLVMIEDIINFRKICKQMETKGGVFSSHEVFSAGSTFYIFHN